MKLTDYIKGERRGEDARQIEFEAMRDPLMGDALEGFDAIEGDHDEVIRRLRERVTARSAAPVRRRSLHRWGAVAAVALLCVAVGGLYLLREGHDRAVYSDVLLPENMAPVDFEALRRMESIIKVEERASEHTREIRSDAASSPVLRRQGPGSALGEVPQSQLDSLVALRGFEEFVESNMAITTDGTGVRVSGTAVAEFTVDGDGHPRNIRILETPAPAASREARRLIRSAPEWPNGRTIRVEVEF